MLYNITNIRKILTERMKSDIMWVEGNEMFTYINLKNFMSFKDVVFDFRKNKKDVKKFISIYGENGSGKSNFVKSIDFLIKSCNSFEMARHEEILNELMKENGALPDVLNFIKEDVSIVKRLENCRMLECEDETSVEYGFRYNGYDGYYTVSFDKRFTYEKLYYFTGKQNGKIFEIKKNNDNIECYFSSKFFNNKNVEAELRNEIAKFWGKHTLLAILNKEREEKNEEYIAASYLTYAFDLLDMLNEATVHYKKTAHAGTETNAEKPASILRSLQKGKIDIKEEAILNRSERILNDFFTQAYADIKNVFYEKRMEGTDIAYELFVQKMIGEKIRTISFKRESAGTQQILDIVRALLGAFCGVTVVYDEIDNGIHDLLLKTILMSMIEDITGQLIITTHNTYLLEAIDIKSVYMINVDYNGNKEVKCLDKFPRIQGTNNPRSMYLKGMFGGTPFVDSIDYDDILTELEDGNDAEGVSNNA